MDDSAPDSSGSLALTLWSQTDSTFAGHVRVGEPVGRGGGVSGWHEGSTLTLYSVSDDGDSVVWTSRQSGEALGGTYEVVGGVSKGSGGTWRANLTSGPPASPATLSRAQRRKLVPPVDAVWPVLALAALIVACARWVRSAPVPPSDAIRDPLSVLDKSVGGWLGFFVVGQVAAIAYTAYELRTYLDSVGDGSWEQGAAVMGLRGVIVVEKLVPLARIVATIVGLRLIATRSAYAPRFWVAYLALLAVYALGDHLTAAWLHEQWKATTGPLRGDEYEEVSSRLRFEKLRTAVVLLVWSMYWCNSSRVRARFGYAALDKPEPLPPSSTTALAG